MHKTILGIDPGGKRTGLAIGNNTIQIASPLKCLIHHSNTERDHQLQQCIQEWDVQTCIIGFPHSLKVPGQKEHSGRLLSVSLGEAIMASKPSISILFINEAYSSVIAESELKTWLKIHKKNKHHIDTRAACIILQAYFDGEVGMTYSDIVKQYPREY